MMMNERTMKVLKGLLIGVTGLAGATGWGLFLMERKSHAKTADESFEFETLAKEFAALIYRRERWLRDGAAKSWFGMLLSEEKAIVDAKQFYTETYGSLIVEDEDAPE